MITYERAKEIWLASVLRGDSRHPPDGFLEDLLSSIAEAERQIRSSEGKEPQHSLLIEERRLLQAFYHHIAGVDESEPSAAQAQTVPRDPSGDGTDRVPAKLSEGPEERFYRISEEPSQETSPVEAPLGPASSRPMAEDIEARPEKEAGRQPMPGGSAAERLRILRVLKEFPCFVGPDLRTQGPFAKEDLVTLSDDVLSILLSRKIGEIIHPEGEES